MMKKTNPNSLRQLRKRIRKLSSLELSKYNKDVVSQLINNSFKMPYYTFRQQKGYPIYRSCVIEKENDKPYDSIKRIAFNPNPDYIERANLKHKAIGYGASSLANAAIEGCQYKLRNSPQRKFYLTIGIWTPTRDLNVMIISNARKARKSGTDLNEAYNSIRNHIGTSLTRKDIRVWILKTKFFAEMFARDKIKHENEYLYSALFSNTLFKSKNPVVDSIWYPSRAYKFKGFNIAYNPNIVESKSMLLTKVVFAKILFSYNYNSYPRIDIISSTSEFLEDRIIWPE
jgi:hypothetical protein